MRYPRDRLCLDKLRPPHLGTTDPTPLPPPPPRTNSQHYRTLTLSGAAVSLPEIRGVSTLTMWSPPPPPGHTWTERTLLPLPRLYLVEHGKDWGGGGCLIILVFIIAWNAGCSARCTFVQRKASFLLKVRILSENKDSHYWNTLLLLVLLWVFENIIHGALKLQVMVSWYRTWSKMSCLSALKLHSFSDLVKPSST